MNKLFLHVLCLIAVVTIISNTIYSYILIDDVKERGITTMKHKVKCRVIVVNCALVWIAQLYTIYCLSKNISNNDL